MKYNYKWDEENGVAICTITDGDKVYTGKAFCHEDDWDMKSERTGMVIANIRADIHYWVAQREALVAQEKLLKDLLTSIRSSKKFNNKEYSYYAITQKNKFVKLELERVRLRIEMLRVDLYELINKKEALYQRIRANRRKEKMDKED